MVYRFSDHLHNYACWTAARAVQRNFTTTDNIINAIETSDLMNVSENSILIAEKFDNFHRICCNQIIRHFHENNNIITSYGCAAKIIAIYLKTSVVIVNSGSGDLAKVIHPPIDRILLKNIDSEHKDLKVMEKPWTLLTENDYFELIGKLRTLEFDNFWELEAYWKP